MAESEYALDRGTSVSAEFDPSRRCPYLSTVDRKSLDFDMDKVCSVTLSGQHVYCCLVCGKYFRGRGKQTPAYTHSVQAGHHVYMSMETSRFHCLPDGYEIVDASLDDVRFALMPAFDQSAVSALDMSGVMSTDAHGRPYLPGLVGINDLNHTDYITAAVQALAHVPPLRNFFLDPLHTKDSDSALVRRFGELVRRLWSPRALKCVVSPHEFVNTVSEASGRVYGVGKAAVAVEFITWLLNTLHKDLVADAGRSVLTDGGPVKRARTQASGPASAKSIITDVFGGVAEVTVLGSELEEERARDSEEALRRQSAQAVRTGENEDDPARVRAALEAEIAKLKPVFPRVIRTPCLIVSLDLPPAPLFREGEGGMAVLQHPVYALLAKFDGITITESLKGQYRERRRYRILSLPLYLLLAVKRFKKNAFFTERNPAIVTFPIRNLELKPYVADLGTGAAAEGPPTDESDLATLPVSTLRNLLQRYRLHSSASDALEKGELVALVRDALRAAHARGDLQASSTKYDLVANVVHEVQANADAVAGTAKPTSASGSSSSSGAGVAAAAASMMHSSGSSAAAKDAAYMAAGGKAKENQAAAAVRLAAAVSDPILRGKHKVHVHMAAGAASGSGSGGWYEVQDAHVAEALPQLIGVSDTVLMVYARR